MTSTSCGGSGAVSPPRWSLPAPLATVQRVLAVLLLACSGAVVGATPALASQTCATAVSMVPGSTEMGPVMANGTVGTFERSDWWRHTGTPSPRTISVTADNAVDLFVHGACGGPPICDGGQTCTAPPPGDLFIEVRLRLPATFANYTLTVAAPPPTECSDGVDNDSDQFADFPADPHCTSTDDATEARVRVIFSAGMAFGVDTTQSPMTMTLIRGGVLATHFTCAAQWAPIGIVCTAKPNPDIQWACGQMALTASAPQQIGTGTSPVGFVVGTVECDAPVVLRTNPVVGQGHARTTNTEQGVTLGTADRVVCASAAVPGRSLAEGSFSVACVDPGFEWPYGPSPVPGDYGDAVVEVLRAP